MCTLPCKIKESLYSIFDVAGFWLHLSGEDRCVLFHCVMLATWNIQISEHLRFPIFQLGMMHERVTNDEGSVQRFQGLQIHCFSKKGTKEDREKEQGLEVSA